MKKGPGYSVGAPGANWGVPDFLGDFIFIPYLVFSFSQPGSG